MNNIQESEVEPWEWDTFSLFQTLNLKIYFMKTIFLGKIIHFQLFSMYFNTSTWIKIIPLIKTIYALIIHIYSYLMMGPHIICGFLSTL